MVVGVMEELRGGEAGGHGDAGLRFALRFDPMHASFDRALLGFPASSALISRLLGWSKNISHGSRLMAGEAGGETAAVIAAAVLLHSAALFMSDLQLRRARRRRLAASGSLERTSSASRLSSLPAPDDGLKILASDVDGSLENVIHGTSIGAGDEEPVLVARVEMKPAEENADEESEREQDEVKQLWLSLVEREHRLELRLMELDSLREQEATVRELENRVSVSAVETRLLELKVSSLQAENERLKAGELDAVRGKLGRVKEKLQALQARVQDEAQREAAALRERVKELVNNATERALALALEKEVAALREANAGLEEKKMELALILQNAGDAASPVSIVLGQEEDMVEEANHLRESNEQLRRQIEQLHIDHCAHVEELVYLKWVNACLRHELGGHHPSSAQQDQQSSTAMDLSKSKSYRSSEKAKQLMLRYGNLGMDGFDPAAAALFSPMNESIYGDDHHPRGDHDDPVKSPGMSVAMASAAAPAPGKGGKLKFLGSIKKLLASNKKAHGHRHDRRSKKTTAKDEHLEKAMRWLSSHDGDNSYESTPLSSCELKPDYPAGVGPDGFHGRSRPS